MSKYFIFGNGQFAELLRTLLEHEKKINSKDIFFITKNKTKKLNQIDEKSFLSIRKKLRVFIGLGDIDKRIRIINILRNTRHIFPNFISKSSKIMKKCNLGIGNIILPNCTILPSTHLRDFNIIGTSSTILHHCSVEDNCVIGGGSIIGSGTKIKKNVFVGIGSTIASKKIKIGSNAFLSSGSVILNDIPNNTKVIGNPARKIL